MSGALLCGRYRLLEEIGRGGFGRVYLARDAKVKDRFFAIKALHSCLGDAADAQRLRDLLDKEQKLLSWLSHPSIVQRREVLVDGSLVYLVMEYIDGEDLRQIMARQPRGLSPALAMNFAEQICEILTYLHSQKPNPIIFRDLKPSNLMLTREGRIKLIDFGIARMTRHRTEDDAPNETVPEARLVGDRPSEKAQGSTNIHEAETEELEITDKTVAERFFESRPDCDTTIMGTPGYAAPEQYGGSGMQTDQRADIYSLGAILFNLLTQEEPANLSFPLPPLHRYVAVGTSGIEELVTKATAFNRDDRYRTARAMATAIQECRSKLGDKLLIEEVKSLIGKSKLPGDEVKIDLSLASERGLSRKKVQTQAVPKPKAAPPEVDNWISLDLGELMRSKLFLMLVPPILLIAVWMTLALIGRYF